MTDRHDNELQALFDSAGQELPGDAFNARIMAGIDGWETTSRILSVLQGAAALGLMLLMCLLLRDVIAQSPSIGSALERFVEGPWLPAAVVTAIAACLMPGTSRRAGTS